MAANLPFEITPREVKRQMDAGTRPRLVDVREPFEVQQARIDGAELVPMRSVAKALPQFEDEEKLVVVFCHHGVRSLQVVGWLREQGIENCASMSGGIDRWSLEIDPLVPRYV